MLSSRSSTELQSLLENVAHLVLWQGYEWTDHVLHRAWIDHNRSSVALRSDAPFHDLIVEDFAHENWVSGQLFKLVRDALLRADIHVEDIAQLGIVLRTDTAPAEWRRDPGGAWQTLLEAESVIRLRNGTELRQRMSRDRLVPNVMLLSEGYPAQPRRDRPPDAPFRDSV